jgi:hypothetical protein
MDFPSDETILYHLDNLRELDPDQLVSDLNLSTQEILDAFPQRAIDFVIKEFM